MGAKSSTAASRPKSPPPPVRAAPPAVRTVHVPVVQHRDDGADFSGDVSFVYWRHDNGEVGSTAVFEVNLFCKNKNPYTMKGTDIFRCEVKIGQSSVTVVTEPRNENMAGSKKIIISFNPTVAGEYRITVAVNDKNVGGETYTRVYTPGPLDPLKSSFGGHNEVFIIKKDECQTIRMVPKDRFGNFLHLDNGSIVIEIKPDEGKEGNVFEGGIISGLDSCDVYWTVFDEGHFSGSILYKPTSIVLKQFEVICLSDRLAAEIEKNASSMTVSYGAQLVSPKNKNVVITLTPRQMHVFESLLFGAVRRKFFSCRVSPTTKIILQNKPNMFSIEDGSGNSVTMSSESRECIVATYHRYRLNNLGSSISFAEKHKSFNEQLKQHHFGVENRDSFIRISVSRQDLLKSTIEATKDFKNDDWLKLFVVKFIGEEGMDAGGLSREFFELLTEQCFSSQSGIFKAVNDSPQALVHPCRASLRPPNIDLSYYKFTGKIVGKCIVECALGKPLLTKARFTRSFLVQILGLKVNSQCLKADDPQMYDAIVDNSVEGLDLFFVDNDYDGSSVPKEVPLKKKGQTIPVTDANKMEYLNLLTEFRMSTSVKKEIAAFVEGLSEFVPEDFLTIFDEQELELLMCGTTNISIEDLRKHTVMEGSGPKWVETVSWFWVAIQGFTSEDMSKFLQFVTGSSRLPARGFVDLSFPICIRKIDGQHGRLPFASTCFNRLLLPTYDSYQQLHSALLTAINEGSQGFSMC